MGFEKQKQADDFIRIQDLFHLFISKWYWFAASVLAALVVVALYLLVTPPIYTRTASILVKDDSKGGTSAGSVAEFEDLGIFRSNTNVNNELITLKSPSLMKEVVLRLDLDKRYIVQRGLRKVDLYKESPVLVTLKDPGSQSLQFDIVFQPGKKVELSNFARSGKPLSGEIEGALSDTIVTPVGVVMVTPTPNYNEEGNNADVRFVKRALQSVVNGYSNALQAVLGSKDATVIDLSIKDQSTRRAEDILNTLIAVYNEDWMNDKNRIAISTSRFINERLNVIEHELGDVDQDISSYKSEHILPDVNAVSGMYLSQYAESGRELLELNNRLSIAEQIRGNLGDESGDRLLPANSGIDNANLEGQIGEYNALLLRRNSLLSNSSERNPLVIDMTQSLADMRQAVIRSVDNLVASLHTQIDNVKKQEARVTGQIASNPNQARYLLSVERQQKVKEALYLYLLQKREENELSQAFTAYNTRIIMPPHGPLNSTEPRRPFLLLVALLAGTLLPLIFFVVKERTNTTVRGRKDLEGMTIPFVGEIPMYRKGKKSNKVSRKKEDPPAIMVRERSRNIINEAYRVVRTNLEFMSVKDNGAKVIMLTSMNPYSGKTFMTMNLAASFAVKGKRVLAIDLDMRKALLSKYVRSPKPGIADYLGHQVGDWQSIIVNSGNRENLDVLPVGTIPPNPTELLFDERWGQLIRQLRDEYDYIFIDCPPVEIVADASIINKQVDMTLFIVRAGLLDRALLPEIENFYTSHKYKNMALILNGTDRESARYGYGYAYGYGSGYIDEE
ncbi:GumC family protein [Proteiniphilum acetatigenes]|uniref:GumC family protein n=1 Tax=Proteiniphilum acetatigenes TaxID=294710 RepID=UPI0003690D90|nr:polysaccharide biosynthesis tyrosine autokinase [Proteiniphilum acetatigenes]SFL31829.1 capsular exopolysaccharide family [Porphyromonadaceae bacterium KH3CP3RA]